MEIVGIAECLQIMGIRRQHFHRMRMDGKVPDPIVILECGPIWDKRVIEEWDAKRNKKRGRPKRKS